MPYNLTSLAKRSRPFRAITPNTVLEADLLRLYTPILNRWRTSAATRMAIYATADIATLQAEDDNTDKEVAALLALIRFRMFFEKVETWHRAKWLANVTQATGVDAAWMTAAPMAFAGAGRTMAVQANGGVVAAARGGGYSVINSPSLVYPVGASGSLVGNAAVVEDPITTTLSEAIASAQTQAKSLSDEAQNRINQAILAGKRSGSTATEVARAINAGLTKVRARAGRIAENELDNAVKGFTTARMAEAGLDFAKWSHTPQRNPRPDHERMDGNLYKTDDPVWNLQFLPNCKCQKVPVLKLGKFSGI